MKKILLLTLLLAGINIHLNANTFKENKKACDTGDANGCNNLAWMYDIGSGVKQDAFKAGKLYTKACDAGHLNGCYNLALMYYYGSGMRQNDSKAKNLFGKACDAGEAKGCTSYAILNKR